MYVKKRKKKKKRKNNSRWRLTYTYEPAEGSVQPIKWFNHDSTLVLIKSNCLVWSEIAQTQGGLCLYFPFIHLFFPRAVLNGATCIDHNQEKIWGCTGKNVTLFVLQMHHNATPPPSLPPPPIMCLPSPSSAPSPCRRERPGAEGMSSYTCECSLPDSLILYLTEVCADDNLWPWPWLQGISRPSVQATD